MPFKIFIYLSTDDTILNDLYFKDKSHFPQDNNMQRCKHKECRNIQQLSLLTNNKNKK